MGARLCRPKATTKEPTRSRSAGSATSDSARGPEARRPLEPQPPGSGWAPGGRLACARGAQGGRRPPRGLWGLLRPRPTSGARVVETGQAGHSGRGRQAAVSMWSARAAAGPRLRGRDARRPWGPGALSCRDRARFPLLSSQQGRRDPSKEGCSPTSPVPGTSEGDPAPLTHRSNFALQAVKDLF